VRQSSLWVEEAEKYGADLERVQVWDALSEMFLDSYRTVEELDQLAERIADTPFSFSELGHILFCEVGPVCFSNTLWFVGGEGVMFGPDWLIPRCLSRQKKSVYSAHAKPDELPVWMHLVSPLYLEAYMLIYRVKRLRAARSKSAD
jgi:hypothetical protein